MFTWTIHMILQQGYTGMQDTDKKTLIETFQGRFLEVQCVTSLGYGFAATQQSDAACLLNCYTLSGPDLDLPFDSQTFKDFQALLQSQASGCDIMMNVLHHDTEYFTPSKVSVIHMIYRINNWMLRLLRHTPARVAAAFDNTAFIISLIVLFYRRCPLKG